MMLEPTELEGKELDAPSERAAPLQWNLQTLFLLTAAVAVWLGYRAYRQPLPYLQEQVAEMQRMTTELVVVDPREIAFAEQPEFGSDLHRWEIYLPEDGYLMRLATRKIDRTGLAPVLGEASVLEGRHRIDLRWSDSGARQELALLVDDQAVITAQEDATWDSSFGVTVESPSFSPHRYPDSPVILLRYRFEDGARIVPTGPTNGLLLWIERVESAR